MKKALGTLLILLSILSEAHACEPGIKRAAECHLTSFGIISQASKMSQLFENLEFCALFQNEVEGGKARCIGLLSELEEAKKKFDKEMDEWGSECTFAE